MAERRFPDPARPSKFEDRYRLYLDESGDHVFRETEELAHRYLCLLGCWFRNPDYLKFHEAIEVLKSEYLPHHPDDPVILHREDMLNARKAFKNLRDAAVRSKFDDALLEVIKAAEFKVVAVVKHFDHATEELAPFAQRLMGVIEPKFNRQLYEGRVEGYGMVLYPNAQK